MREAVRHVWWHPAERGEDRNQRGLMVHPGLFLESVLGVL